MSMSALLTTVILSVFFLTGCGSTGAAVKRDDFKVSIPDMSTSTRQCLPEPVSQPKAVKTARQVKVLITSLYASDQKSRQCYRLAVDAYDGVRATYNK